MWVIIKAITIRKIKKAIREKRMIKFIFEGKERIVEPYIFGMEVHSSIYILYAWFVDGFSNSGFINPDEKWRSYPIKKIKKIEILVKNFKGDRKVTSLPYLNFCKIIYKIE